MGSKVKQRQAVQKSGMKSPKNLETSGDSKRSKAQKATKVAKNAKAPKTSKKSHKKRIVAIVLAVVLLLGAISGVVAWIMLSNREPEMSDWAEVYLTHIKTVREQDRKNAKNPGRDDNSDDDESFLNNQDAKPAVSFYESENNSPTMVVNYTSVENNLNYNSVAVYSIRNEEIYLLNYENTNLYYAYDIDMNTYNFYLKHENEDEGEDTYVDIEDYFKDPEADESEYEKTCSTDQTW